MAYQPKSYRKFLATSVAAAVVVTAGAASVAGATKFSDVPANHFAVDHINYLVEKGAISGYADGTFKPNASITRAELSRILVDTLGLEVEENVQLSFTDTRDDAWYAPYVAALADKGIIQGNPDGTFAPGKTVTRAELAIMVVAAYELEAGDKEVAFPDVKENVWYTDAINTLASNNIVVGKPNGTFAPGDAVTRGEATAFVHRTEDPSVRPDPTPVLTVKSVTVVDATSLTVVLSDDTTHEVTLDEALEANVETEVTFEIDGKEYTATVTWEVEEDGALAVESVSAITTTGVDVVLPTVTEAVEDFSIEVVTPNGTVVPVKPINLEIGDAAVTFEFVTPLTEVAIGNWTVGGVSFDTGAQAAVNAVLEADTQVKLFNALQSSYFKGAVAANIETYDALLTGLDADEKNSVALIQKNVIDAGNVAGNQADAVKAVADATNQVQLLSALQNSFFKRVNPDFIADYDTVLDGSQTTVAAIQTDIDTVNYNRADTAVDAAEATLSRTDLNTASTLVDALKADEENETAKADLQARVALHSAVVAVNEANTNAKLTAALTNLAKLSEDFDIDTVNSAELTRYRNLIAAAGVAAKDSAADIQVIVATGNTAAEAAAVTAVAEINANTTTTQVEQLLRTLANRSSFGSGDFDVDYINTSLLAEYRTALVGTAAGDKDSANDIALVILSENDPVAALAAIDAATTQAQLYTALTDKTLNLQNVTSANQAAYVADLAAFKAAADSTDPTTVGDVKAVVNAVNAKVEVNATTSATVARTALTNFAIATGNTDYLNLSSTAKLEVAELVLAVKADNGTYADIAALTSAIDAQVAARQALVDAVNTATTIVTTDAALDALEYTPYANLSAARQIEVAEAFLAAFPVDKDGNRVNYTTVTAIRTAVNSAIAATN